MPAFNDLDNFPYLNSFIVDDLYQSVELAESSHLDGVYRLGIGNLDASLDLYHLVGLPLYATSLYRELNPTNP